MSLPRRFILVHLVGHHDLYLTFGGPDTPVTALHRGHATLSTGRLAQTLMSAVDDADTLELEFDGDAVRLDAGRTAPTTGWSLSKLEGRLTWRPREVEAAALVERPVVALRAPLLAAAVAAFRDGLAPGDEGSVVLVTTGPLAGTQGAGKGGDDAGQAMGHSTAEIGRALTTMLRRSAFGRGLTIQEPQHLDTHNAHDFGDVPKLVEGVAARLAAVRRAVVADAVDGWTDRFKVFLSLNTGPVPVITGLARGLSEFQHVLVHVPDARKWPCDAEQRPVVPHASIVAQKAIRQRPARAVDTLPAESPARFAVEALRAWRQAFTEARPQRAKDLAGSKVPADKERCFWFRKGEQEVLAVVVVADPSTGALRAFRGVNLEVSLPTGTLCAERNAIGSAFAALPTLERRHLQAVAVLSLGTNPELGPCGACQEWLQKMADVNPDLRIVTFTDEALTQVCVEAAKDFSQAEKG